MSNERFKIEAQDNSGPQQRLQKELRRRWLWLMPVVFFTYSLAYLGRSNFGFGAAAGLARSLNITESRAAFLGSVFFLGYFLFQVPAAAYAQRKSATRLIFFALISWGVLSGLTGVIRDYWLLVVDRTLLGVAESLIFPSMLILLTNWFTRTERSRANAVLILGNPVTVTWMAAVTGYLIKAVGWQWTFILEGIPSVIWAFVWIAVASDRPHQASWLSPSASQHLEAALEREQTALPPQRNLASALRVPGVILLCIQYFFWSFGVYGLVLWIPEMIRSGSSRGIETIGLLSAAPFLLAVVLMLLVAHFSDRALNRKVFVWPFLLLSGVALFCLLRNLRQQLLAGIHLSDRRRRSHVRALRPVLRHRSRDAAQNRRRRSDGPHQHLWSHGRLRRHMAGWLASGPDRQRPRRIPRHVLVAAGLRRHHSLPARAKACKRMRLRMPHAREPSS